MRRIMVIGNGGGGKTTLARRLGAVLALPVHHVDSIQFRAGWERTPPAECDAALDALAAGQEWIIDGFGSFECIARRVRTADTVVFVDFALWRHYAWALKRQLMSRWRPRSELPEGCREDTLAYTWLLVKVMWRVHREIRPWLLERFGEAPATTRILRLRVPGDLARLLDSVASDARAC